MGSRHPRQQRGRMGLQDQGGRTVIAPEPGVRAGQVVRRLRSSDQCPRQDGDQAQERHDRTPHGTTSGPIIDSPPGPVKPEDEDRKWKVPRVPHPGRHPPGMRCSPKGTGSHPTGPGRPVFGPSGRCPRPPIMPYLTRPLLEEAQDPAVRPQLGRARGRRLVADAPRPPLLPAGALAVLPQEGAGRIPEPHSTGRPDGPSPGRAAARADVLAGRRLGVHQLRDDEGPPREPPGARAAAVDAALCAVPGPYPGQGRPAKKGDRLPTPLAMIGDTTTYLASEEVIEFPKLERRLRIQVVRGVLWYTAGREKLECASACGRQRAIPDMHDGSLARSKSRCTILISSSR